MKLSQEEQQIILDFYFRCGSDEDIRHGRDLIAANSEASRLYAHLEETLTELDSIKYEPCPENLVELTVARLKLAASAKKAASQDNLERLLAAQAPGVKTSPAVSKAPRSFLKTFFEISAAAAAIVLMAGMFFPAMSYMRAYSRRTACMNNMRLTSQAMATFASDSIQQPSEARISPGSPWWKIGDQGKEPQSNTRFAWLLVKNNYVEPKIFICPGHSGAAAAELQSQSTDSQLDFASRQNISYSFMMMCDNAARAGTKSKRIIMSDRNPVFSSIPCRSSAYEKLNEFEKVLLNDQLRRLSSPNHSGRGQNVLQCDGSVKFLSVRIYNGDDIFTVRGVESYTGREVPADDNDIFLVP